MFSVNKRFLVAPVIALTASAMLVSQAQSRGFRGGPVGYHFPVNHPGFASHPGGTVNHSGMTMKPSGTLNHHPTMSGKSLGGANHPKASSASKGKAPSAATSKSKGSAARPWTVSGDGEVHIRGRGNVVAGDGSINNSPGATLNRDSNNRTVTNNFGSNGQGGSWWQWYSLPAAAGGLASGGGTPSIIMESPSSGAPFIEPPDLAGAIHELGRLRGRQTQVDEKESDSRTPGSSEQKRPQANLDELRHNLKPALSEIYSGNPLNFLLDDLQGFQALGGRGPQVVLDADLLRHINVIWKQDSGNIGLLKKEGRLTWPTALRGADYQQLREVVDTLAPKAIEQAVKGSVNAETLELIKDALDNLHIRLAGNIEKLSTPRHIEAKRFLGQLDDALKVLAKPHAGEYFSGKYSAQGKTVADLVQHMTKHGLKFASAVAGDETAYEGLHRAMAVYDVAAHYSKADKERTED